MKIFFITPFEGKQYYQKDIDKIISLIEETGTDVISAEKTREYKDVFRKDIIETIGDKTKVHYEFIKQGVLNADAVIVEATYEDFRVGHETTLALLYKKPVLCLSQKIDYSKYISHEFFQAEKYNSQKLKKIINGFIKRVNKQISENRNVNYSISKSKWGVEKNSKQKVIAVLGSINMDMVTKVPYIPKENDVLISEGLKLGLGGKAANASIGISRLGEKVYMLGKVGNDFFGENNIEIFKREQINTEFIDKDSFIPTGTVMVNVDNKGKNTIIVNEDSNIRINKETIYDFLKEVDNGKISVDGFYTTLEPLPEIVSLAINEFSKRSIPVFCDAAPQARPLSVNLYGKITFLAANEFEAASMAKIEVTDPKSAIAAAKLLQGQGARNVIITLGQQGAVILPENKKVGIYYPGIHVKVIDETGAGDAFRAGFIVEYLESGNIENSMNLAVKTGAYAVTRLGTYDAMPSREELSFLKILK